MAEDPAPDTPSIEQQTQEIKSVVEQTWNDLSDIGEVMDKAAGDTTIMKGIIQKLYKNQLYLEQEIKKTIAVEVEKQIQPLVKEIHSFTKTKPRFIYIKPKLPSLNIFRFMYNRKKT